MEIYIEYALAENFCLDAMLLWLALKAGRQKISPVRLIVAAGIGAAFAVAFPLLDLGKTFAYILKFSVGILLCLIAVKGKGIGRYALTAVLFFGFSFALGGGLLAVYSAFSVDYRIGNGYVTERAPVGLVIAGCFFFAVATISLAKRIYRRRTLFRFIYPCKITLGERTVKAEGFLDSGNRASERGIPVCFLSADLAYDLLGEKAMTEEMTIMTMGGESKIKIFLADRLEIYCADKPNIIDKVYFSPSGNIRAREYKIVLNAAVLSD